MRLCRMVVDAAGLWPVAVVSYRSVLQSDMTCYACSLDTEAIALNTIVHR